MGDELNQGFYSEKPRNIREQKAQNDGESREDNFAASLQELQCSVVPLSPGFMWQYTFSKFCGKVFLTFTNVLQGQHLVVEKPLCKLYISNAKVHAVEI